MKNIIVSLVSLTSYAAYAMDFTAIVEHKRFVEEAIVKFSNPNKEPLPVFSMLRQGYTLSHVQQPSFSPQQMLAFEKPLRDILHSEKCSRRIAFSSFYRLHNQNGRCTESRKNLLTGDREERSFFINDVDHYVLLEDNAFPIQVILKSKK